MRTPSSSTLSLLLIALFLTACGSDESFPATDKNNTWKVGEFDAGNITRDTGGVTTTPTSGPFPVDLGRPEDMRTTTAPTGRDGGGMGNEDAGGSFADLSAEEDMRAQQRDMAPARDMRTAPDSGATTGGACGVNSDCVSSGDLCCPALNGQAQCTQSNRCLATPGGYCDAASVRTDCGQGKFCCPPQFGSGQNVCSDRACRPQGTQCTTNSQCTKGGEVCCPRSQAGGECRPEAMCRLGGGFCQSDAECSMRQPNCCSFFGSPKVCSDRMCP